MKTGSKIFLDTNILVYSTLQDYDIQKNMNVVKKLNHFYKENDELFISTQVLREFYAVVTNTKYLKNPLTPFQANNQIEFFNNMINVLPVTIDIFKYFQKLSIKYNITGQKIHDTTIVATMLEYEIENIYTYNVKDFKMYKEIKVIND